MITGLTSVRTLPNFDQLCEALWRCSEERDGCRSCPEETRRACSQWWDKRGCVSDDGPSSDLLPEELALRLAEFEAIRRGHGG